MAPHPSKTAFLTALIALTACTQGSTEQPGPPADPTVSPTGARQSPAAEPVKSHAVSSPVPDRMTVPHVAQDSRWRFEVPPLPVRVESMRFDPTTPDHKIKERFELTEDGRLLVRIDVWANPRGIPLSAWMDLHVSHLRNARNIPQQRSMARAHVSGVLVEQPRSGQSHRLLTGVFPLDGHVVAITCADGEHPAAVQAFETLLDTFAVEGGR